MPLILNIPEGVVKEEGRWVRYCPTCSVAVSHARKNYCIGAHNSAQPCKKCSNSHNNPSGMIGSVRVSWFESFRKSAITRGYVWELTPEYVDTLYQQQNGVCALSDFPIGWSVSNWNHTASLDRIDNEVGYIESNVQLVHKKINMMRGSLSVENFIEMCAAVAASNNS
jgi:hypothetical protein